MQNTNTIVTWFQDKEEEQEIVDALQENGYDCISCSNKKHFLEITGVLAKPVCLIIIDLSLEEDDAISICNEIKNKTNKADHPFIIMVSNTKEEYVQITALDLGVDDYIIKPTKPRLLLKRMEAILSRKNAAAIESTDVKEGFFIDPEKYRVVIDGKSYKLPKKEFEIIKLLYNKGRKKIFSRNEIAVAIWEDETILRKRTIDVHIFNIRKILGDDIITSGKGVGYSLNI
jgi:two-component system alkaline phosphatase synthesis response regulator PhoP